MKTIKKNCFYTATYHLPSNSVLKNCIIKDPKTDEDGFIIFEKDKYNILVANDTDGKISQFIYKSEQELSFTEVDSVKNSGNKINLDEQINTFFCKSEQEGYDAFYVDTKKLDEHSSREIENCISRLHIYFFSLKNLASQTDKFNIERQKAYVKIYDYNSKTKFYPVEQTIVVDGTSDCTGSFNRTLPYQKIVSILKVKKDNINEDNIINEYIRRFLVLEKLSGDLVLYLLTLFSLYEYIKETSDNDLDLRFNEIKIGKIGKERVGKKNFQDKELTFKDKFVSTRNLAAHGLVHEYTTVHNLEQILEIAPPETNTSGKRFYSFNRYNPFYMKLVNEVISEVQPIIHNYLREELELKE